jgi:hypothetical protein
MYFRLFFSEHLDIFLKKTFIKTQGCVGYIFPYPGIIARPVSGSPSSAYSPAECRYAFQYPKQQEIVIQ